MKQCQKCFKPLTEFEMSFHTKAQTPEPMSNQCWSCSGADKDFEEAKLEHSLHTKQISACIIGIVAIFALFLPTFPYWNQPSGTNILMEIYSRVLVIAYFIIGYLVTKTVLKKRGALAKTEDQDPPEERYRWSYGIDKTEYVSKERYDGAIVTEKFVRPGSEQIDQWKWTGPANGTKSTFDKISDGYGNLIFSCFMICIRLLLAGCFAFWVIPYILVVNAKDNATKKYRNRIPHNLQKIYRASKSGKTPVYLTYHDKVGFLVSRENAAKRVTREKSFLDKYQQSDAGQAPRRPYFYTYKKDQRLAYMIVDYHRPSNRYYGVSFVLVENRTGGFDKKMIVGNEYVDADPNA